MIYKTEKTCNTAGTYRHKNVKVWFHCDVCKIYLPIFFIKIYAYTSLNTMEQNKPVCIDGVCSPECEHLYILRG